MPRIFATSGVRTQGKELDNRQTLLPAPQKELPTVGTLPANSSRRMRKARSRFEVGMPTYIRMGGKGRWSPARERDGKAVRGRS